MKKLATLFVLIVALSVMSFAQNRWNFAGYFPDSTFAKRGSGVHGLAVDPAGKIWVQWFGNTDSIQDATSGLFKPCRALYVFNPNGTQASFSPIKTIVVGGVRDTLYNSNRGLKADHQGNILVSSFDALYRVNYQTGAGMNKVLPQANNTLTAVAADTLGEIFAAKVLTGTGPIQIFASNFSSLGNVVDTSLGFSRTIEVSKNGNDVYFPAYTLHRILRYHSDFGSFGPYVVGPNDTLFKGFDCESMAWNQTRTRLWASAGSAADRPNRYPGAATNYSINTWYAWNPANGTITDSLKWKYYNTDSANTRPRGVALSPDGLTAYVGCFGASSYPSLEKFTFGPSSVEPDLSVIPTAFTLSQNYPNPFNPSTEIKFTLTKSGFVTLKVYSMLGQEVATLVNEDLGVGGYTSHFDASRLSSGTYMYRLTANGQSISKKMMLVK